MKKSIQYNGNTIEFELKRTARKTLGITIMPPGIIKVVAPLKVSEYIVIERVRDKGAWIMEKLKKLAGKEFAGTKKEFKTGEVFLYLGKEYALDINTAYAKRKPNVELCGNEICICSSSDESEVLRQALEAWYRKEALKRITERVKCFQKYFKEVPSGIQVKEQKKRWASCTGKDKLLFNWRCIMASADVIDYIVLHEMCHMVHKNHSKEYWTLVESLMPDYKKRRDWLKAHGSMMDF